MILPAVTAAAAAVMQRPEAPPMRGCDRRSYTVVADDVNLHSVVIPIDHTLQIR